MTAPTTAPVALTPVLTITAPVVTTASATATTAQPLHAATSSREIKKRVHMERRLPQRPVKNRWPSVAAPTKTCRDAGEHPRHPAMAARVLCTALDAAVLVPVFVRMARRAMEQQVRNERRHKPRPLVAVDAPGSTNNKNLGLLPTDRHYPAG